MVIMCDCTLLRSVATGFGSRFKPTHPKAADVLRSTFEEKIQFECVVRLGSTKVLFVLAVNTSTVLDLNSVTTRVYSTCIAEKINIRSIKYL